MEIVLCDWKRTHFLVASVRTLRRFARLPTGRRIWHVDLDVDVGKLKMSIQFNYGFEFA